MREIILDTETTGLNPLQGHRIVEIGCIELIEQKTTGKVYHTYINPEKPMPKEAFEIHGLSTSFLKDFPKFSEICEPFLSYIGDSPLVIHNASFDIKFLNSELTLLGKPPISLTRCIDTIQLAKKKFPGSPAKLDTLCQKFDIDLSRRTKHGALLDAELLLEVYLGLVGKRQPALGFIQENSSATSSQSLPFSLASKPFYAPRPHEPTPEEQERHRQFMAKIAQR